MARPGDFSAAQWWRERWIQRVEAMSRWAARLVADASPITPSREGLARIAAVAVVGEAEDVARLMARGRWAEAAEVWHESEHLIREMLEAGPMWDEAVSRHSAEQRAERARHARLARSAMTAERREEILQAARTIDRPGLSRVRLAQLVHRTLTAPPSIRTIRRLLPS